MDRLEERRARRTGYLGLGAWATLFALMGALAVASLAITPEWLHQGGAWMVPACPTRSLLGRECPTCGMTRAFAALGHGRVREALHYNRSSPVAYTFVWASAALGAWQAWRTFRQLRRTTSRRIS